MNRFILMMSCMAAGVLVMGDNMDLSPLSIEGTKIASETEAKNLARVSYVKKMGTQLMAEEGVHQVTIVTLGYNIPDFAQRGEKIWEVRVMSFFGRELRSIIWINPRTEKVRFVCGPWETKPVQ